MGRKTKNEPEERYLYNGEMLTAKELAKYTDVGYGTLYSRLRAGWSVERAMRLENDLDPKWEGKDLLITFQSSVGQVKREMQPILGKTYIAHANKPTPYYMSKTKHFFVIKLENGKDLIVYPGEFDILGEAPKQ